MFGVLFAYPIGTACNDYVFVYEGSIWFRKIREDCPGYFEPEGA